MSIETQQEVANSASATGTTTSTASGAFPLAPQFASGSAVVAIGDLKDLDDEIPRPPDGLHEIMSLREGRVYKVVGFSQRDPRFLIVRCQDQVGYAFEDTLCALNDWLSASPLQRRKRGALSAASGSASKLPSPSLLLRAADPSSHIRPRPVSMLTAGLQAQSTSSEEDSEEEIESGKGAQVADAEVVSALANAGHADHATGPLASAHVAPPLARDPVSQAGPQQAEGQGVVLRSALRQANGEVRAKARPLTEVPSSMAFKRYNAVMELVATEESYVRDLHILETIFATPLSPSGQMAHLLGAKDHQAIFGHVGDLIVCNSNFLRQLQVFVHGVEPPRDQEPRFRPRAWSKTHHPDVQSPEAASTVPVVSPHAIPSVSIATSRSVRRLGTLGEVIQSNLALFKAHETYSCHHKGGRSTLTRVRRENVLLDTWLKACERGRAECRSLDLEAFLHAPVQRITRYPLLLKEILKLTEREDSEWAALSEAAQLVEQYVRHINEETRIVESDVRTAELLEVLQRQSGKDFSRWFDKPQEVCAEGNVRIRLQTNKRKWISTHVYLYTEVLLVIKADGKGHGSNSWRYVLDPIPLSELLVVCNPSAKHTGRLSTVFEIEHIGNGIQVRVDAESHDNKLFWVRALQEQCADKGRWRRRRGAVATVEVGQTQSTHYLTRTPVARQRRNPVMTPLAGAKVRFGSPTFIEAASRIEEEGEAGEADEGGEADDVSVQRLKPSAARDQPSFEQLANSTVLFSPISASQSERRGGFFARRLRPVSMPPLAPSHGMLRDLDELIASQEKVVEKVVEKAQVQSAVPESGEWNRRIAS
jgi:hypothetical protein